MRIIKKDRYRFLFVVALLLLMTASGFSGLTGRYKDYNLLIVSITNIGTDHMSLYGYKRKTTPGLAKWSADALVFEDAFTPASWTLPVGTSLFTSLYPYSHHVMGRTRNVELSRKMETLPEILKKNGYKTAAFTGGLDYMSAAGHMRGFLVAPNNPPFSKFATTIPQASQWLSRNSGSKFFLLVHGYDPHPPFLPSPKSKGMFSSALAAKATVDTAYTYRGYTDVKDKTDNMTVYYHEPRPVGAGKSAYKVNSSEKSTVLTKTDMEYLEALYDETVYDVDLQVSAFLDSLDKKMLEKTIVIVLSEHGEMFARHGRFGRAGAIRGALYDDVAHVPLMVRLPGIKGRRIAGLAQIVDYMPTITALLGLSAPAGIQGTSLLPLIEQGKQVNDYVYAGTKYNAYMPETYQPYQLASVNEFVRNKNWKLIHEVIYPSGWERKKAGADTEIYELYDLKNDPGESNNLFLKKPEVAEPLRKKLESWSSETRRFSNQAPILKKLPDDILEKAKQHGYW